MRAAIAGSTRPWASLSRSIGGTEVFAVVSIRQEKRVWEKAKTSEKTLAGSLGKRFFVLVNARLRAGLGRVSCCQLVQLSGLM